MWQDGIWRDYGEGQVTRTAASQSIEETYQRWRTQGGCEKLSMAFTRLDNSQVDNYELNVKEMTQTNLRTNFVRKINRKVM